MSVDWEPFRDLKGRGQTSPIIYTTTPMDKKTPPFFQWKIVLQETFKKTSIKNFQNKWKISPWVQWSHFFLAPTEKKSKTQWWQPCARKRFIENGKIWVLRSNCPFPPFSFLTPCHRSSSAVVGTFSVGVRARLEATPGSRGRAGRILENRRGKRDPHFDRQVSGSGVPLPEPSVSFPEKLRRPFS